MSFDNSESEDDTEDRNPQNGGFDEQQITKLLTCLHKILQILLPSLKKVPKRKKERRIKKGTKRAKKNKVSDPHNDIRKLCNSIKGIGYLRSSNLAEVSASGRLAEAIAGTSRSQTEAVAGTSRSYTEAVAVTSRSHTEAVAGTSRSLTEAIAGISTNNIAAIAGTSRGPTEAIAGTTTNQTEVIPGTSKSHTPAASGTYRNHTEAISGTSKIHTPAVAETSRSHIETIAGKSGRCTEPTAGTSGNQTEPTAGTARSHTETISVTSKHRKEAIPGTSSFRRHTEVAVSEITRDHTKRVPVPVVISKNQTNRVPGPSISHTKTAVTETSKNQTKIVPETFVRLTEATVSETLKNRTTSDAKPVLVTPRIRENQNTETSQTLKPGKISGDPKSGVGETINYRSKIVFPEAPTRHAEAVSQTPTSQIVGARISSGHTKTIVTETKKSHTQSALEILRSHTETHTKAVPGTSRSHTKATSRKETEASSEKSRNLAEPRRTTVSHTKNENSETSVTHIAVDPGNFFNLPEQRAGTAKGHTESIVRRNSSNHIEAVPGTSRNNTEAVSSSKRNAWVVVPETIENDTMLGVSKSNSVTVHCGIPRYPFARGVSETITDHLDPVDRRTSKRPAEVTFSNNSNKHINAAEREKSDRHTTNVYVNISEDDSQQKESTNLQTRNETKTNASKSDGVDNISETKRNIETSLKRNHADINLDDPKRSRLDNKLLCKKSITNQKFEQNGIQYKIKHNKENYGHQIQEVNKKPNYINTNEAQNGMDAKEKKSADAKKITATRSETTPNRHIKQAITNSSLGMITDINIANKQAEAKKRTVRRSESTPNRHIEHASAIPTLVKITNTDKNNISIDRRKSTTEKFAKDVRTEETLTSTSKISDAKKAKKTEHGHKWKVQIEKESQEIKRPDCTSQRQIEEAITKSTLAKPAAAKENKSGGENERKTKGNDSAPNGHIERAITWARTNADTDKGKKLVDAKSRATRLDSMPNERNEEIIANSTPDKITDSEKAKKVAGGKKKKVSGFRAFKNTTFCSTIDLTSDDDELGGSKSEESRKKRERAKENKTIKKQRIIDISKDTRTYGPTVENKSMKVAKEPSPTPAGNDQVFKDHRGSHVNDIDEDTYIIGEDTWLDNPAEEKASVTIKKSSSKPTNNDHTVKNEQVIDISEDTCLDGPAKEKAGVSIKKSSLKPTHDDQLIKNKQVIDISEDTCFDDPAEEKANVTIKKPISPSTDDAQTIENQPVIDIREDTCLNDASGQKLSMTINVSSPKTENDNEIFNNERAICDDSIVTNLGSHTNTKRHPAQVTEDLEKKRAEELLAEKVKQEQTSKHQLDNNVDVGSINFLAPWNQKANEGNHKTVEENTTQIKQRPQGFTLKKRNDEFRPTSKTPYEKPKNNVNKLNPAKVYPKVTNTTKAPDASALKTSTTIVQQTTQKANQLTSTDKRSELSISRRPTPITPSPNLSITSTAYPALIQQSVPQTARPNLNTSTRSEHRTILESRPGKPKPATASKRPSSDSGPSSKLDASTIPREQITNTIENNTQMNQAVSSDSSEWRAVPLTALMSQPNHSSGNTGSSSTNYSVRTPTKPKAVSTSRQSHAPHGTARNSNPREPDTDDVQSPQTHWYRPVPLGLLTSNQGTRNVSEGHTNRNSSTKINDGRPLSWHRPVSSENERPGAQSVAGVPSSSATHQSNLPSERLIPASQRLPSALSKPVAQPPPLLLIPRQQSTMMDTQRAPIAAQPTSASWHIPTISE